MPRVVHGNVKCNPQMVQSKVEHDIKVLRSMKSRSKHRMTIWIGNEIEIPRYTRAWSAILRAVGGLSYCTKSETPITMTDNTHWKLIATPVVRLRHKGRATVSPNRYSSIMKLTRGDNEKLAIIGTHMISGGWHSGFKAFKAWRRKMWYIHFGLDQTDIATLHSEGYDVLYDGDLNRIDPPKIHPDAVVVVQHGLDHMVAIPAKGHKVVVSHVEVIGDHELFTDHPFLAANVDFVNA